MQMQLHPLFRGTVGYFYLLYGRNSFGTHHNFVVIFVIFHASSDQNRYSIGKRVQHFALGNHFYNF